ncbi:MAG: TolC family protein [Deltaproteobacteria bacterium]|nr:TolC family protein [Deltaproteobacteria bacterium]
MKPTLFITLLCCLSLFTGTVFAGELSEDLKPDIPQTWTAENAVAFAIVANPDSFIAQKRIEEAQATAEMAKAADYPLINLSAEYAQTNTPMYSFGNILNQGAFNNSIDFNDPGRTDNLNLKAMIAYRLYNGGRDQADMEAAESAIDMSRSDLTTVYQRLGFEVIKTFQAIVQAEEMVKVRHASLDAIKAALGVAKARYDAGDLLRADLLNLELQVSVASEELIQSEHNLELTKRSFLNLLGLREGEVILSKEKETAQQIPEVISYTNREELKRLQAMEQASLAHLKKAEGAKLPTVDAFASYQLDAGTVLDESGDSWMAGIKMDYNLFDGRRTSSAITQAKIQLQKIRGLVQKTELALNLEIQQAQLNYKQAKQRLAVTDKMVAVAEEGARLSRVRFKEGVILASDLIDFELHLTDAQARHLAARARHKVAIANLRRVAGLSQFPGNTRVQ